MNAGLENKTGTQSIYQYQRVHIIFLSKGSKDGGRLFLRYVLAYPTVFLDLIGREKID